MLNLYELLQTGRVNHCLLFELDTYFINWDIIFSTTIQISPTVTLKTPLKQI